jgi:hypothetical protein
MSDAASAANTGVGVARARYSVAVEPALLVRWKFL